MRKDFTLDNVAVSLPCAYTIGHGKHTCKRGDWLVFTQPLDPKFHGPGMASRHYGRSLGRVRCEGKTFIYVIALTSELGGFMVRWVPPEEVRYCQEHQPTAVGALIGLDMNDQEMVKNVVNPQLSDRLEFGTQPWRKTK